MNRSIRSGLVAFRRVAWASRSAIGLAKGRVAGSSWSRKIDPTPWRSRISSSVASSGLAFRKPFRYGTACAAWPVRTR